MSAKQCSLCGCVGAGNANTCTHRGCQCRSAAALRPAVEWNERRILMERRFPFAEFSFMSSLRCEAIFDALTSAERRIAELERRVDCLNEEHAETLRRWANDTGGR